MTRPRAQEGYSLIEMMVAVALITILAGIVTTALSQMTKAQGTIWNRTEMHSAVRGATELLAQEVGQAGRVAFPAQVTLTNAVTASASGCTPSTPAVNAVAATVSSTAGMFATAGANPSYIMLTTLDGDNEESFRVASVDSATQIQACFRNSHAAGTVLFPLGGFATGVVPPTGIANGSTDKVLKLYGDVNGDGNMVYVEYTCDPDVTHSLYRNAMSITATSKPKPTAANVLLSNITQNPGGTACFTYQTSTIVVNGTSFTFVTDVAITLTVQTQQKDPLTQQFQTETKALLNVSPRNVFDAWAFASIGYTDRMQSTPTSITALLPDE
jgi:prepilin-type N-terminal cleavage/methylation domain-containing protein